MNAQLICVDHINRIIEDEDVATELDLGSIRVIKDHSDQCKFLDIIEPITSPEAYDRLR